jgi:hypothetical protein
VPFERTTTFRRFGSFVQSPPFAEDRFMKSLIAEQGLDGLPHVVTAAQLDTYIQSSEVELFRGESAPQHAEQLRSGELFVGQGSRGGGIYAVGGPQAFEHAAAYAQDPGGVVVRMSLKRGAHVADADALVKQMERQHDAALRRRPSLARDAALTLTTMLSVYACYLGFDGVMDRVNGIWLLLNRTALRIQEKDLFP